MNDLITTIVVTVVLVLVFGSLIFITAMYWTQILRRIAPNRFSEPMSEKKNQQWPQGPNSPQGLGRLASHLARVVAGPVSAVSPITTPQASRQSPERMIR
ncbi:hypothetical protein PG991_010036 [Apiospora marii]|uniref:Uncharacterized protein n=1 Tax=Apiospora marii TaxID=335849 RepID=A0ABR1RHB8_9PEZI